MYCSFCGKSQHEVIKLIAGLGAFICDECVVLCVDIIVEENVVASKHVVELNKLRKIRSDVEVAIDTIEKVASPMRIEQAFIGNRLDRLDSLQESLRALLTRSAEESTSPTALPVQTEPAPPPLES